MPIYEYECDNCTKITEEIGSITDNPQEISCTCGEKAHKIMSKNSFILKGSGWEKDGFTSSKDKGRNMGVAV